MKILPLVVALIFLAFVLPIASADDTGSVKVISKDGKDITDENHEEGDSHRDNGRENGDSQPDNMGFEPLSDEDYIRNEISAGNKLFVVSTIDALYEDLKNNPVNEDGEQGGVLFTVVTFVPNPYEDKTIIEWYGGYLNLTLYAIALFVLGELISRSIARTKIASGALKHKDLSGYRFMGGIAICGFALIANIFYQLSLEIIEALNEFIMVPAIPNMAINPDNLILLCVSGLCDLLLVGFFVIRFFIIYVAAVLCSVIAFLLVPESTREFAADCIEKLIRLLLLQPAALFVTAIGFAAVDRIPFFAVSSWCLWLTLLVFLTCWYFMFGKFTLLKTAVVFAIRKGVTKI